MEGSISERTVLFVGGSIEAVAGIELAQRMGLYVVVSDANPHAPGCKAADDFIVASTYDVEATVWAAKNYHTNVRPIGGVIAIASDVPLTVARVAEELGLRGISVESAKLAMDKLAMKRRFQMDGVPVPWFSPVESPAHLERIVDREGYPLVLKPVDSRGSRGVLRLTPGIDLDWAYETSVKHSPTNRVMVERFLDGPQVSTESIVMKGVAYTPGFSDRNYEYLGRFAPFIIENGGDLPSTLPEDVKKKVLDVVQKAALSLGVTEGVVKGDIVVHKGEPYVIELAARLSGGYFCTHEIPLNTGVDFVGNAIRLALGEEVDPEELTPKFQRCVSQRYIFPTPGKVVSVRGLEAVYNAPGIAFCDVRVKIGDVVGPINSHPARAGVVIAVGDTREEAIERALSAMESIVIETVPV